jgi:hypothetical protein
VAAINLTTTLPKAILPLPLPLKLFLDIGSFSEAWKAGGETGKFLYVGGFQLSFIKGLVNIYVPLVYSNDFKTYLKTLPEQNTLAKKITFSIDLHRVTAKKLAGNYLPF